MENFHDIERYRLRLGSYIVGCAIGAAVASLIVIVAADAGRPSPTTVTDKVALLGAITTFLGLVVGVFFGVNASGSAQAQNAASAIGTAQAAGTVAEAARSVTETARSLSDTAARSLDAGRAGWGQTLVPGSGAVLAQAAEAMPGGGDIVEYQSGDPDEAPTPLKVPVAGSEGLDSFSRGAIHIAIPAPAETVFAQQVLHVATAEADAHVSRDSNRLRVTEYLALLGLPFADAGGVPTRYCAAGVTWAVCRAYCDSNGIAYTDATRLVMLRSVLGDIGAYYFKPSALCQAIMDNAKARSAFMSRSQTPKPGYLVFFNWSGQDHAEHIGLVAQPGADAIGTVEFNTMAVDGPNQGNGGSVSRKERPLKFVLGYARTWS